jgi:hypothetical protein
MYFPWDNIVPLFHGCSAMTVTPLFKTLNGHIVLGFNKGPGRFPRMFSKNSALENLHPPFIIEKPSCFKPG